MTTAEELQSRIINNTLSIGCYMPLLIAKNLISEKETDDLKNKIEITYSTKYGTSTKYFYIS